MMMTSLLLDARPVQGDPRIPGDDRRVRRHATAIPAHCACSWRNPCQTGRDCGRCGTCWPDAAGPSTSRPTRIRPVVDIARWAALAVGSSAAVDRRARLAAAAGSADGSPGAGGHVLIEVFEVLAENPIALSTRPARAVAEKPSDVLSLRSAVTPGPEPDRPGGPRDRRGPATDVQPLTTHPARDLVAAPRTCRLASSVR